MREVSTQIDVLRCTGCGLCVEICPSDTIEIEGGKARVVGVDSLGCDHCAAVCPAQAVSVGFIDEDALEMQTLDVENKWIPFGKYDAAKLVQLMRSRRSCRNFSDEPMDLSVLQDLVKIGITAPSGTNSQLWNFTILPDRAAVDNLGGMILKFFKKINRLAGSGWMRLLSKPFLGNTLQTYYEEYYETVKEAIIEYERNGRDRLFHGAPSLIIVGMKPGASCPCEDALLASQNILLASHAIGYGSCLIGFAVEAMMREKSIKKTLGIPASERVYAVIAIGKSRERYRGLTGRRRVDPRMIAG